MFANKVYGYSVNNPANNLLTQKKSSAKKRRPYNYEKRAGSYFKALKK